MCRRVRGKIPRGEMPRAEVSEAREREELPERRRKPRKGDPERWTGSRCPWQLRDKYRGNRRDRQGDHPECLDRTAYDSSQPAIENATENAGQKRGPECGIPGG